MPVTSESLAAAKRAQAKEREEFYLKTGVRITDDGRIDLGKQS